MSSKRKTRENVGLLLNGHGPGHKGYGKARGTQRLLCLGKEVKTGLQEFEAPATRRGSLEQ